MTPTRVLVVDDSRTIRSHVRGLLSRVEEGAYEVMEAADGADALKWLESAPAELLPDVIVLDRNMPRVSGDACIRILKSDPVWKRIPVLFLTAQSDKSEIVRGISDLRCDDYLSKPFDDAEMVARVGSLGRMKKAEDKIRALNRELDHSLQAQRKTNQQLREALDVISSSIRYSSHIQKSILPPPQVFDGLFKEHFILWQPRDVVGGDIYWSAKWAGGRLFALGDCTGHGVPGAFMTLIATGALARARGMVEPMDVAGLMQRTHQNVQKALKQHTEGGESDDGMELAICWIPPEKNVLLFSGARFSLFTEDESGELVEIKGDRKGIGYRGIPLDFPYAAQTIPLREGQRFYMTTDGLIDQIGGPAQRGFGKKRFLQLLASIRDVPLPRQGDIIYDRLLEYQGNQTRRDDISVMGFIVN